MATTIRVVLWVGWAMTFFVTLLLFLIDVENAPASVTNWQQKYVPALTQLLETTEGHNRATAGTVVVLLVVWSIPPALWAWRANRYGVLRIRFGEGDSFVQDNPAMSIRRIAVENIGGASIERVEVLIDSFTPQGATFLPLPLALMQGNHQPIPLDRHRPVYVEVIAYSRYGPHPEEMRLRYEDPRHPCLIPLRKRPYVITIRACGANIGARVARFGIDVGRDGQLLMWRQRRRQPRVPRRLAAFRLPDVDTPLNENAHLRALQNFDRYHTGESAGFPRREAVAYVQAGLAEPAERERQPKSERRRPDIGRELERLRTDVSRIAYEAETMRGRSPTAGDALDMWRRFRALAQGIERFIAAEISPVTAAWVTLYTAGESDAMGGRTAMALLWDLREVAERIARKLHDLRKDY